MQDLFSPSVSTRDFVASYACTQFMLLSTGLVDTESSTMRIYAQAQKSRDTCLKLFLRLWQQLHAPTYIFSRTNFSYHFLPCCFKSCALMMLLLCAIRKCVTFLRKNVCVPCFMYVPLLCTVTQSPCDRAKRYRFACMSHTVRTSVLASSDRWTFSLNPWASE